MCDAHFVNKPQFLHDPTAMDLDRLFRNIQLEGDLFVQHAGDQIGHDFVLARSQPLDVLMNRKVLCPSRTVVRVFGQRHPGPLDTITQLDGKRKLVAVAVLAAFVLTFTPIPLTYYFPEAAEGTAQQGMLVLAAVLSPLSADARDSVTVSVLPYFIHSQDDIDYLGKAIADMLATRLNAPGEITTVQKPAIAQTARRALRW